MGFSHARDSGEVLGLSVESGMPLEVFPKCTLRMSSKEIRLDAH